MEWIKIWLIISIIVVMVMMIMVEIYLDTDTKTHIQAHMTHMCATSCALFVSFDVRV